MRRQISLSGLLLTVICCMTSGCAGLTIGPTIRTEYVVMHPGRPVQVLENASVTARVIDGTGDAVTQDIGGWYAMPPAHFEALKRAAEGTK